MDAVLTLLFVGYFVIRALLFVLMPVAVISGVFYLLVKLIDYLLGRGAPGAGGHGDG